MGRALAVIIWILTALSVLFFVSKKWWFPASISEHGPALDRQFMITLMLSVFLLQLLRSVLGWVVWKYRDTASPGSRVSTRTAATARGALDCRHCRYLHHTWCYGPKRLGVAPFEQCTRRILLQLKWLHSSFNGTSTTQAKTESSAGPIQNS